MKQQKQNSPQRHCMGYLSKRSYVCTVLTVACALLVGSLHGSRANAADDPIMGVAKVERGWSELGILNVREMPWDKVGRFQSKSKTFFKTPADGGFIYSVFSPTWDVKPPKYGLPSHYHLFHEWGYTLKGDLVIHEPVTPYQTNGALYRFTQGTWLDRPAYSLHGGTWEVAGLRPQNPIYLLLFEEGDGGVITVGPNGDHFKPDFPDDRPDPYRPDWKAVEQFTRPWIVDSGNSLEWETDKEVPGRFVKWLSDDMVEGFRSRLVKIPPGWSAPAGADKTYFKNAQRLRYMLYGAMKVWSFDGPNSAGEAAEVKEDFFIYQPPRSIWGYGSGPVTEEGAVWLEVTYANGLAVGGGPLEEPSTAR
ncbi:MAG: hypothetical protein V3R81_11715 [Gammaproteobacteria bacterium]